jgi:predicted nucleic acid-binding protein
LIVIDTKILAYFLIRGEHSSFAEEVREIDPTWAAPLIWRAEMRNVLVGYLRREVMTLSEVKDLMSDAEALLYGREYTVEFGPVLELAYRSGCSAYDCEFVYLAEKLEIPLVTSDRVLLSAFPSKSISMTDYLTST